jgi:hypothetical protein
MVRQRTWAIALGEVCHHRLQGREILSPDVGGYWVMNLLRTST